MARNAARDPDAHVLRALLSDIEGVADVVVDTEVRSVCIVARAGAQHEEIAETARSIADGFRVMVAFEAESRTRQRVRFISVDRAVQPDQQVGYSVTLEWAGHHETAEAVGDKGESVELRTAASAALGAVSSLVPEPLGVRLAGVKQVRAFDADLVVVSLYRPEGRPRNLVGAVVAADEPARAAVYAVLNALNRLLGNYLSQAQ